MSESAVIRFTYQKAESHRTFHVSGAWATTTPAGEIQIAFYNDIRPLPVSESAESAESVIREVEFTVLLHPEAARGVAELLLYIADKDEHNRTRQPPSLADIHSRLNIEPQ